MKRVNIFFVAAFVLAIGSAFVNAKNSPILTAYYPNPGTDDCEEVQAAPCKAGSTGCIVFVNGANRELFGINPQTGLCTVKLAHD